MGYGGGEDYIGAARAKCGAPEAWVVYAASERAGGMFVDFREVVGQWKTGANAGRNRYGARAACFVSDEEMRVFCLRRAASSEAE